MTLAPRARIILPLVALAIVLGLSVATLCSGVEEGPPNGVIGAEEGPLIPMV